MARRGAAWLAQRRQRHAVRREEQRRREVTECTFQPLTKTTRTTSTTARTSSKVTPSSSVCRSVASPRGAYDRQMQWRQKLDQKVDQQRQRRKELEHLEHLEHLEQQKLHQKLSRNPPSNSAAPATASTASVPLRSPREVDEAFERFHQRSRQWQQACALRVMKARHEHQHHECRGYTKDWNELHVQGNDFALKCFVVFHVPSLEKKNTGTKRYIISNQSGFALSKDLFHQDVAKAKRGKRASRDGSQPCRVSWAKKLVETCGP